MADGSPESASGVARDMSRAAAGGVGAVVCERCGAPLPPGLRAGARYCSKRCRQAASRARLRDRPCFPPPTPTEVCAWCGEAMPDGRRGEAVFCSKRCRQASSRHSLRSRASLEGSAGGSHAAGGGGKRDRVATGSPKEPPWRDGWLHQRFYSSSRRGRTRYELPPLDLKATRRALTGAQLRQLRSQWLATTVSLVNFAGYEKCSRAIVVNRLVDLHELVTIVCAAIGFEDDEHLYHLKIADGFYSAQQYVWVERAEPAGNHTLGRAQAHTRRPVAPALRHGRRLALPRRPAHPACRDRAGAARVRTRAAGHARRPLPHPRPSSQAIPARRQGRRLVNTGACRGCPAASRWWRVAKLVTRAGGAGGRSRAA